MLGIVTNTATDYSFHFMHSNQTLSMHVWCFFELIVSLQR